MIFLQKQNQKLKFCRHADLGTIHHVYSLYLLHRLYVPENTKTEVMWFHTSLRVMTQANLFSMKQATSWISCLPPREKERKFIFSTATWEGGLYNVVVVRAILQAVDLLNPAPQWHGYAPTYFIPHTAPRVLIQIPNPLCPLNACGYINSGLRPCPPHLFPSASSVESGSSMRLVSGSRKPSAPPARAQVLNKSVGTVQWRTSSRFTTGDSMPATRVAVAPRPVAVCLTIKEGKGMFQTINETKWVVEHE